MPFVVANGVRFHFQQMGAGPTVVMLHGLLLGNLATWYFTAAPALARTQRVLLYDLRGHGRSERVPSGYGLSTMAEDLRALVGHFARDRVQLVGHSWGALVALRFALDHPERVERLAVVEAPMPPSDLGALGALVSRRPEEMIAALPVPLQPVMAAGGRQRDGLLQSLRFLAGESSLRRDLAEEPGFAEEALARVRCPVLCVYGSGSPCRGAGERLTRAIPSAELAVLPGGHYLHVDAARALTGLLLEFIRNA